MADVTRCKSCGKRASIRLRDACESRVCRLARVRRWQYAKGKPIITWVEMDDEFGDEGPRTFCRYCGDTADTVDHLLPRAWTGEAQRRVVQVVPACRECNSILGATWHRTISERREHVREALRRKYRKALTLPVWDKGDLAELDGALRAKVEASQERKLWVMERLRWPASYFGYREGVTMDGYGRAS